MAEKAQSIASARRPFKKKSLASRIYEYRFIYILGLPGILILIIFRYLPMWGLLMAFQNYNPHLGIMNSPWVGLQHFQRLFSDPKFYNMLKNTLVINGLSLLTFPAPIILALLLHEVINLKYRKFVQTVVYLPHFISWAIVVSLTFFLLSTEQGIVNKIAVSMGKQPYAYLFSEKAIYPIIIIQEVWKSAGWGSIVYLAAITGIDKQLYEAAKIDGANKFQQIMHITIPSIMPTIVVMLILKMGSMMSVDFEQVWLMNNAMVKSKLEVFEIYIYNNSIASGSTQYSYTTAIGMFKSVISTVLVVFTNWLSSRKGYEGVL
uniref:LplB, putative aldouronate transport system permease protein n=1 Tax=uncultured firmicutes bacterium contig_31 TaxID=1643554 RepID=A0A141GNE1_9FIRM|nr:lplB, putative aldouronate transport system permease protein [uncultured firmicutes bacterium contig_31]